MWNIATLSCRWNRTNIQWFREESKYDVSNFWLCQTFPDSLQSYTAWASLKIWILWKSQQILGVIINSVNSQKTTEESLKRLRHLLPKFGTFYFLKPFLKKKTIIGLINSALFLMLKSECWSKLLKDYAISALQLKSDLTF